jgi:hypothetical protein
LVRLLRRWLQGDEGKAVWVAQLTDETICSVETAHCCCGIKTISESGFVLPDLSFLPVTHRGEPYLRRWLLPIAGISLRRVARMDFGADLSAPLVGSGYI